MATQNPALAPIISVVQKALQHGGGRYLTELYSLGYNEYRKHNQGRLNVAVSYKSCKKLNNLTLKSPLVTESSARCNTKTPHSAHTLCT